MLDDGYEFKLAEFEIDLLRPSSSWPTPPWQVRVDGAWVRNAFTEVTAGARPFISRATRWHMDCIECRGGHACTWDRKSS